MDIKVRSQVELEETVLELGFLPFFKNIIPGFSIEEATPEELWFSPDTDGPWEWKGPLARRCKVAYGKLFSGKAGFVSLEHYSDLVNYRRDGYDFDARYDDGLALRKDKTVYDCITAHNSILSKDLKAACNYADGGSKGFETVITRLQMQTYVTAGDFEYSFDKSGKKRGWGVVRYTTPELMFGAEFVENAYKSHPKDSYARLRESVLSILPDANEKQLAFLLG